MNIYDNQEFETICNSASKAEAARFAKAMSIVLKYKESVTDYLIRIRLEEAKRSRRNAEPVMTWGKHRGTKIKDLPEDYITWICEKSKLEDKTKDWFKRVYYTANPEKIDDTQQKDDL
jgi:uncharacterized protein (DUF3820 family)